MISPRLAEGGAGDPIGNVREVEFRTELQDSTTDAIDDL
jgi:hypothetical protein